EAPARRNGAGGERDAPECVSTGIRATGLSNLTQRPRPRKSPLLTVVLLGHMVEVVAEHAALAPARHDHAQERREGRRDVERRHGLRSTTRADAGPGEHHRYALVI